MFRSVNILRREVLIKSRGLSAQAAVSFKPKHNELQEAKSFKEIPGLSRFELIKRFMLNGQYQNLSMFDIQNRMREEFGDFYRMQGLFGNPDSLTTFNAEDVEFVHRNEGSYPHRRGLQTLKYYREKIRPDIFNVGGLIVEQGHEWQQMRSVINPILMQPRLIKSYLPVIDGIVSDFINVIPELQDENGVLPANFHEFLNRWSLESITAITLEKRLGLLDLKADNEAGMKIQKNIRKIFTLGIEFEMKPSIWKFYQTKGFKELIKAYDELTETTQGLIDVAVRKYESDSSADNQGILFKMLEKNKKFATVMAFDMIFGGVDTTASALAFVMYCLAKNPGKQEKLREELFRLMPNEETPLTEESMKNLPYLRACIKESLRLFPPATMNMRRTNEDLVLKGYHVPKGVDIVLGMMSMYHDAKNFKEPTKFIPERFLRRETEGEACPQSFKQTHNFAYLPFGYGPRFCVGKRIAEMEIESFISRIFRRFKVEWNQPDMKVKLTMVLLPDSELKFKLTKV